MMIDAHRWGGKGVRVANCPIGQEWCYPSCHWRKGKRCYFGSKYGRWVPELMKVARHPEGTQDKPAISSVGRVGKRG